jgi:WD40 repeat protein
MNRTKIAILIILALGLIMAGCQGVEEESESTIPTAVPTTQLPSPESSQEPSPTETAVLPTLTSTPEPLPTATPSPLIQEELALLSYRNLSQVEELASISQADVIDLEFSPDGSYLRMRIPTGEETHRDSFIELESGQEIFSLEGSQRVYFNPDSSSIASLDGNSLTIYKLPSGDKFAQFNSRNQAAALSPDGRRLVEFEVYEDEDDSTTLRVIDLTTEEEIFWVYVAGKLEKENLHFDGDGQNIAVTYFVPPGTYVSTIWDANTGRAIYTEYGYAEIALHPFGSEIAVSSSRKSYISLVSTVTWDQIHYLGTAEDDPGYYNVTYASGGRLIYALSDGERTSASFWYPPSGERIDLEFDLDLLAVTISPDRRLMATSDKDGSVIIWGIPE